jgi:peptidoglycan/xylan/chitin deacetylase (PgdA/CDA1 family)
VAARELTARPRARFTLSGTPVLMYHALTTGRPDATAASYDARYCVTADTFAQHLRAIRATGRSVVDLDALERADARTAAVVTFDDGLASDHDVAVPRLREAGMTATFFVNSSTIGRPGHLGWPEMRAMHAGGMSFGSHGHDHVYLTRLSPHALDAQLRLSKARIEDGVGTAVHFVAVPFGDCNARVVTAAHAAGYHGVCTSLAWPARRGASTINRIAIGAHTSPAEVEAIVAAEVWPFLRRGLRAVAVYAPKRARLALRARRGAVPSVTVSA